MYSRNKIIQAIKSVRNRGYCYQEEVALATRIPWVRYVEWSQRDKEVSDDLALLLDEINLNLLQKPKDATIGAESRVASLVLGKRGYAQRVDVTSDNKRLPGPSVDIGNLSKDQLEQIADIVDAAKKDR